VLLVKAFAAVFFVLMLLCPAIASAQTSRDTIVLMNQCEYFIKTKLDGFDTGECIGTIRTFRDLADVIHKGKAELKRTVELGILGDMCIPISVTQEQLILIFIKFCHDHPERLHEPYFVPLVASFHEAFPCHGKGNS
jgi:hypothetical protein